MTMRPWPHPDGELATRLDPLRLIAANINPVTGLANDYLNHFNEAIMALELLETMPDCLHDLLAWKPESYHEHFANSRLRHRELAIAAYDVADPRARRQLDEVTGAMNAILVAIRETLRLNHVGPDATALAQAAVSHLKPLVARAGAVINGSEASGRSGGSPQAAIDALLRRR